MGEPTVLRKLCLITVISLVTHDVTMVDKSCIFEDVESRLLCIITPSHSSDLPFWKATTKAETTSKPGSSLAS